MLSATEPLVVTISHRLGREEAKRRIDGGLDTIRRELAAYVKTLDYRWDGYSLDFQASAMLQTITGRIEVFDDHVRVELGLPRLLHLAAKAIAGRIERQGATLLEGPKKG
jgi:Putative polyhydroxyalkanoic acid system protein (PHA_gran_rgn)